ncbi:MAG TPA: FAD:protein FMN transferase [Gemmatimonadales bacterium]|jgi:thiamine biosynthesis lipoprotein
MMLALGVGFGNRAAWGQVVRYEFVELHMGVAVRLVTYMNNEGAARTAAHAAFNRIGALEDVLSDYRPTSELRRLSSASEVPTAVSRVLADVLGQARTIAEWSDGAFDPTAGTLTALWREARANGVLPTQRAIDEARGAVGWRHLTVDTTARTVVLGRPGMRLDLGGIAKGYVLDAALRTMSAHGATRVLIQAGGDLVVGDAPPGRSGWRVATGIDHPVLRARASALVRSALAVSGDAEQYLEVDGVRYSHTIDPRTGWGVRDGARAVVVAPTGALADGVATAIAVMGMVPPDLPPGTLAAITTDSLDLEPKPHRL